MKAKFLSSLFLFSVLFISCSSDDDSGAPDDGNNGETQGEISTFTDIPFELIGTSSDPSILFSTSSGTSYKVSEVNTTNVASIDIASFTLQQFIAFESPDIIEPTLTGATTSKFQHLDVTFTAADFDSATDDTKLKDLTIVGDEDSISSTDATNKIILFENAAGKKGAIKIKAINAQRVLVDIKVQK